MGNLPVQFWDNIQSSGDSTSFGKESLAAQLNFHALVPFILTTGASLKFLGSSVNGKSKDVTLNNGLKRAFLCGTKSLSSACLSTRQMSPPLRKVFYFFSDWLREKDVEDLAEEVGRFLALPEMTYSFLAGETAAD